MEVSMGTSNADIATLLFTIRSLRAQLASPDGNMLGEHERTLLFRELVGSIMLCGAIRRQATRRRSPSLMEKI
jgi:hypothetical protein